MTDYQNKKGRLTKKKGNAHFKPELDDDFFGFGNDPFKNNKISTWEIISYILLIIVGAYILGQILGGIFSLVR